MNEMMEDEIDWEQELYGNPYQRLDRQRDRKRPGDVWAGLEGMSSGVALMVDWVFTFGSAVDVVLPYLELTGQRTESFPCPAETPCGCRHTINQTSRGELIATCGCDWECGTYELEPADLLLYGLNRQRFGEAIRRALELGEPSAAAYASAGLWEMGTDAAAVVPVYLSLEGTQGLLRELTKLLGVREGPFLVLTPTGSSWSPEVAALARAHGGGHVALASVLSASAEGFQGNGAMALMLARFKAGMAVRRNSESGKQKAQMGATPHPDTSSGFATFSPSDAEKAKREGAESRYSLRKGLGTWEVVFAGRRGLFDDERGAQIVAYLLRNPPAEPMHAVPLEAKVWARDWAGATLPGREAENPVETDSMAAAVPDLEMDHEASGAKLNQGENTLLKQRFRELLEIIEDPTLPQDERDAAQVELDEIHASLDGAAGRVVDGAAKAAVRVRKAIKRLHTKLANASDEKQERNMVLRDFAEHLLTYLIIPSSRFNRGKGSRNRAGVAGTFIYEPPPGVVWEE